MLKKKILGFIKEELQKWFIGFNEKDFNFNLLGSEKIALKNLIFNPEKIDNELRGENLPIRLKAGMIGRLTVKTNLLNMFSDLGKLEIHDLFLVFGPNTEFLSDMQ